MSGECQEELREQTKCSWNVQPGGESIGSGNLKSFSSFFHSNNKRLGYCIRLDSGTQRRCWCSTLKLATLVTFIYMNSLPQTPSQKVPKAIHLKHGFTNMSFIEVDIKVDVFYHFLEH